MPFHFSTDADRQAMREAAEEMRVHRELVERYTVCREGDCTPITPGQMQVVNGLRRIDPNRPR
ncbi:hypothetical protein SAMN05660359_03645 [Geodermatophilus obscurus]|uniref:Uncharacterized protein n=1 Tax=Geodermatophilus obscurus TaxID=1861 RepID=A0A1I5HET2_9ACTN|nr:hypothetical protein [Geodermatophilus obscurus]SFO46679.1 hypothetical protein SAMN05660359_03645 [Geodermatophilus obscurus]